MRTIATLVLTAVLAAGCGTSTTVARGSKAAVTKEQQVQEERFIKSYLNRIRRVSSLAFPILRANAALCGQDVKPDIGALWLTAHDIDDGPLSAQKRTLMERFWIRNYPMLVDVVPSGPAAAAGLRKWDMIVAVNGKAVPSGRVFWRVTHRSKASVALHNAVQKGNVSVTYARRGVQRTVRVTPATICRYNVGLLRDDDSINAFADGNGIYLTMGMYRFAKSDLELQTIIAHELAHNTSGHLLKAAGNRFVGAVVDTVIEAYTGIYTGGQFAQAGALAFSQDFEREADYVGMYMLERAGIDSSEAGGFWRRMSMEDPTGITFARTHPTNAERFVNLQAASREIKTKKRWEQPLLPNPK